MFPCENKLCIRVPSMEWIKRRFSLSWTGMSTVGDVLFVVVKAFQFLGLVPGNLPGVSQHSRQGLLKK